MMTEISFEELDSFYFRKDKMRACVQEVLDILNGRHIRIKDLICEDGKLSKAKRDALIEELMECLKIYARYRLSVKGMKQEADQAEALNDKRYHCLVSFLGCTLDHLASDPESDLTDLIELSSYIHIYDNYTELLVSYFRKKLDSSPRQRHGRFFDPDLYEDYAQLYQAGPDKRSPDFIHYFLWHYFPIDGWEGLGDIMNFRYQMDASEREIDLMLNVLKRRNIEVPQKWLEDYERDREVYRDRKHHGYLHISNNDHVIAFWNYLHLQEQMLSSEAFENAVSGMIDIYTILHETTVLFDPDRFYEVYDRLDTVKTFSQKKMEKKAEVR